MTKTYTANEVLAKFIAEAKGKAMKHNLQPPLSQSEIENADLIIQVATLRTENERMLNFLKRVASADDPDDSEYGKLELEDVTMLLAKQARSILDGLKT